MYKTNKYSSNSIVLCSRFLYCNNSKCENKHWYDSCYNDRMQRYNSNEVFYKSDMKMIKKEEKEALNMAIVSIKKERKHVIVR